MVRIVSQDTVIFRRMQDMLKIEGNLTATYLYFGIVSITLYIVF